MFRLKIDKELIEKCVEGVDIEEGDKLAIEYLGLDGITVEKVEVLTIKSIEHYNTDLFFISFEEKIGSYTYNLNQLIHFKVNS